LLRKLAQQIESEKEEKRRDQEAAAALARRSRAKTQKEIDQTRALFAAAKALAVLQGRKDPSFAKSMLTCANEAVFPASFRQNGGTDCF
jgi:hypothetical protein